MIDLVQPSWLDRLIQPLHRWIWSSAQRRAFKLFRFAQTEAEGSRDLSRAAELTGDPLLRRLYLRHAEDEHRHAELFRQRGRGILQELRVAPNTRQFEMNWMAPGERGLDDVRVEKEHEESLLAFLHISEKAAVGRFMIYRDVLRPDPKTQEVFEDVLRDEAFHMSYTYQQLARIAAGRHGWPLWRARLGRLWKAYLRLAVWLAGTLGSAILLLQYFVLLPLFALLAKRSARREPAGWFERHDSASTRGRGQYQ